MTPKVAAFLAFAVLPWCSAQDEPVPIDPLLRHSEPRLVALGAWEALRREDDTFMPKLMDMVERWDPQQRHLLEAGDDRFDAMTVILDVLIQRNQVVSPAGVIAVAYQFPDQALILVSRLASDESEPILLSWYQAGMHPNRMQPPQDLRKQQMLARVAAMMLAAGRPSDIAASVLADSHEQLAVSVPDRGLKGTDRCLMECEEKPPCKEETAEEPRMGWPPVYRYAVEENAPWPEDAAPLLVAAGGDRITYRRVPAEVRVDTCYSPSPLSPVTRHRLLAEMLQISDDSMTWSAQMNLTIPWESDRAYLRRLKDEIDWDETQLRATASALFQKGLLTRSQMTLTRPRLTVTVFDDRQPVEPANSPLPLVPAQDPRTTCHLGQWR